jgi:predicted transglutaminase-like cysteine proteinase
MTVAITKQMRDVAADMRARFEYKPDGGMDKWVFLRETGKIAGDCEDWALTTLAGVTGGRTAAKKALLRGDAEIIYTRLNGRGHAVLRYNGHYIDNTHPHWTKSWRYGDRTTYPRPVIVIKLLLAKVL